MEYDRSGSQEVIRLKGTDEINAAMYSTAAASLAPRRTFDPSSKQRLHDMGMRISEVGTAAGTGESEIVYEMSVDDFMLLSRASHYLLESRKARKIKRGASIWLLDAAHSFADYGQPAVDA